MRFEHSTLDIALDSVHFAPFVLDSDTLRVTGNKHVHCEPFVESKIGKQPTVLHNF